MDIAKIEPETLLSLYSIVFQDVTLFNSSIMENIRLGRKDATDEEVLEAARLATATPLQKNCRRDTIRRSEKTAASCQEESGSGSLSPGHF